ncbi:MAG: hypothetical protein JWN15_3230, partial [Firmicutes bacterium]|nr:hypothetical protein [Bacillota bacterium]
TIDGAMHTAPSPLNWLGCVFATGQVAHSVEHLVYLPGVIAAAEEGALVFGSH